MSEVSERKRLCFYVFFIFYDNDFVIVVDKLSQI
mgnify:CR=1 FL=1